MAAEIYVRCAHGRWRISSSGLTRLRASVMESVASESLGFRPATGGGTP